MVTSVTFAANKYWSAGGGKREKRRNSTGLRRGNVIDRDRARDHMTGWLNFAALHPVPGCCFVFLFFTTTISTVAHVFAALHLKSSHFIILSFQLNFLASTCIFHYPQCLRPPAPPATLQWQSSLCTTLTTLPTSSYQRRLLVMPQTDLSTLCLVWASRHSWQRRWQRTGACSKLH